MVSTPLRDPQALSSTLAALGMLQPQAFGFLKTRRDLGLVSNYIIYSQLKVASSSSSLSDKEGSSLINYNLKAWVEDCTCNK